MPTVVYFADLDYNGPTGEIGTVHQGTRTGWNGPGGRMAVVEFIGGLVRELPAERVKEDATSAWALVHVERQKQHQISQIPAVNDDVLARLIQKQTWLSEHCLKEWKRRHGTAFPYFYQGRTLQEYGKRESPS